MLSYYTMIQSYEIIQSVVSLVIVMRSSLAYPTQVSIYLLLRDSAKHCRPNFTTEQVEKKKMVSRLGKE